MKQHTLVGLVALAALVAGIYFAVNISPGKDQSASSTQYLQRYPAPRVLPEFSLVDQSSSAFTNTNLQGHWSLVFVGYTFCPDICPTTLAELSRVYGQLAGLPTSHPLQVVFLSVDPNRDSPERLAEYMSFFNDAFVGATGEHAQLFPLVRGLGMMYSISESTDNPNYLVDHSASIVVVDPNGQVIGRFRPQIEPGKLAISDVEQILIDMPAIMADE